MCDYDNDFEPYPVEKLLKPEEVALILRISRSFAYNLIQTGQIPSIHLGRLVRVRPQDLEKYISDHVAGGSRVLGVSW